MKKLTMLTTTFLIFMSSLSVNAGWFEYEYRCNFKDGSSWTVYTDSLNVYAAYVGACAGEKVRRYFK